MSFVTILQLLTIDYTKFAIILRQDDLFRKQREGAQSQAVDKEHKKAVIER